MVEGQNFVVDGFIYGDTFIHDMNPHESCSELFSVKIMGRYSSDSEDSYYSRRSKKKKNKSRRSRYL